MNPPTNCHRSHWIQSLRKKNLEPEIVLLECIIGAWPWQRSEQYWIAYGRRNGWPLTNNTSGGDGVCNLPKETRERMAMVWKGRKHSAESVERIRKAKTGIKHSDETKARMSRAHKGRAITWGAKIGKILRKLSNNDTQEILKAIGEGVKVKDLAIKYHVHRTTISKVKMGEYNVD